MKSPLKQAATDQTGADKADKEKNDKKLKTRVDLQNVSPELKSYIYQTILEFEPFSTPQTVVAVVAKDPLKLYSRLEENGESPDKTVLRNMFRISIALVEDGTKIEEEALNEDVYTAIKMAKDKLIKKLCEIQDQIISNQERKIQIDTAVGGSHVH
jgi:ribosome-associated translation inhibitor RaiA